MLGPLSANRPDQAGTADAGDVGDLPIGSAGIANKIVLEHRSQFV